MINDLWCPVGGAVPVRAGVGRFRRNRDRYRDRKASPNQSKYETGVFHKRAEEVRVEDLIARREFG